MFRGGFGKMGWSGWMIMTSEWMLISLALCLAYRKKAWLFRPVRRQLVSACKSVKGFEEIKKESICKLKDEKADN